MDKEGGEIGVNFFWNSAADGPIGLATGTDIYAHPLAWTIAPRLDAGQKALP